MGVDGLRRNVYKIASYLGYGAQTDVNNWLGLPAAYGLREQLKYREYFSLSQQLDRCRHEDLQSYALCMAALGDWPGRPTFLDGWVWYAEHLAESWLARGIHSLKWAFESHEPGHSQPQGMLAMHTFFQRLEMAEEDFKRAAQVQPDNPEPYAYLIASGGALNLDRQTLQDRFTQLLVRDASHFQGHSNMLIALYRRPEPVENILFAFARQVTNAGPFGSPLHALIPQAYIERWAMSLFSQDREAADTHLRESSARTEIYAAYQRLFNTPEYTKTALEPILAGYFAVAFYLLEDRAGVFDAMHKIADYAIAYPWCHLCHNPMEFINPGYTIDRVRDYANWQPF
jgi:hypothetical protein